MPANSGNERKLKRRDSIIGKQLKRSLRIIKLSNDASIGLLKMGGKGETYLQRRLAVLR